MSTTTSMVSRDCACVSPRLMHYFCSVMDPPSPYDLLWPVQCARSLHQMAKPAIVEGPRASMNPFQPKPLSCETQIRGSTGPHSPHPSFKNRRIDNFCSRIRQVSIDHITEPRWGRSRCGRSEGTRSWGSNGMQRSRGDFNAESQKV